MGRLRRAPGQDPGPVAAGASVHDRRVQGDQTPRVVRRAFGDVKLAVLSNVPRSAFRFVPRDRTGELAFADPNEPARRAADLKQAGFVVVLVAHVEEDDLDNIAATTRADLVIRGHTARSEPAARRLAGRWVVKVGGSETLGTVAMKVRDGSVVDLDYRLETVNTAWPLDKRLIQTYQAYAHAAMRKALDAERKGGLDYMSSAECGRCHRPQYDKWKRSHHARAYKTLQKAKRTGDPNCLMCHTSGFGTKKGFYTLARTPDRAGVNCQDCHRFNNPEHLRKGFRFPRMTKDVCTTCHTPVTDPKFDHSRKLAKVRCPHSPPPPRPKGDS